jgi:hypothetical protein
MLGRATALTFVGIIASSAGAIIGLTFTTIYEEK